MIKKITPPLFQKAPFFKEIENEEEVLAEQEKAFREFERAEKQVEN